MPLETFNFSTGRPKGRAQSSINCNNWLRVDLIVVFVPQPVTIFLDKEVKVDIDKVQIEAPLPDTSSGPSDAPSAEELFEAAGEKADVQ